MKFETSSRPWWVEATRSLHSFPADLAAVVAVLTVTNLVVLLPGLRSATIAGASLRTLLGIPVLLFIPGYVLVSMLFPARTSDRLARRDVTSDSIDRLERLALSFGMSIAILPLLGFVLATWWVVTLSTVLTSLTVLLLVGISVTAIRRFRVPEPERYGNSVGQWSTAISRLLRGSEGWGFQASSIVLAGAIVLAIGSIGFAVATPYQSGQSSTLYLVTENETGAQVAAGYPTDLTIGEAATLSVGIENDEERRQPYTVVVALERVVNDTGSVRVTEQQEITRLHPVVGDGEDWTGRHDVVPRLVGDDLRLHYFLYKGEAAPDDPTGSSAYRDVYVWIDVNRA